MKWLNYLISVGVLIYILKFLFSGCSVKTGKDIINLPELKVGGVYSVETMAKYTIEGKTYGFTLLKILSNQEGEIAFREYSNVFVNRPETVPENIDFSNKTISNFGIDCGSSSSGSHFTKSDLAKHYSGRALKFIILSNISDYDKEVLADLNKNFNRP